MKEKNTEPKKYAVCVLLSGQNTPNTFAFDNAEDANKMFKKLQEAMRDSTASIYTLKIDEFQIEMRVPSIIGAWTLTI